MKTLRVSFISLMLVNLIKKNILNFFYCYAGLDAGCSKQNTIYVYFAVVV